MRERGGKFYRREETGGGREEDVSMGGRMSVQAVTSGITVEFWQQGGG